MDCVDLTFKIQKEIFGRTFGIEPRKAGSIFYYADFLKRHLSDYLAGKTNEPADGDCVLMRHRGRLCHVGTLHIYQNRKYIVHTMDSFGYSCQHDFEKLNKFGLLEVEGIYKWK